MPPTQLLERTQAFLDETLPGNQNADAKVRQLIEAEYLRQLARHRRTYAAFTRKYGLSFDEFLAQRITQQKGYSWEVEQDAMAWETAVGGIITIENNIQRIHR
jgi:hypothetical protein